MIKSALNITFKVLQVLIATKVDNEEHDEYKESQRSYGTDENGSPVVMVSPLGFKKEN